MLGNFVSDLRFEQFDRHLGYQLYSLDVDIWFPIAIVLICIQTYLFLLCLDQFVVRNIRMINKRIDHEDTWFYVLPFHREMLLYKKIRYAIKANLIIVIL